MNDSALTRINSITTVQGFQAEPTSSDKQREEVRRANESVNQQTEEINRKAKAEAEQKSRDLIGLQDRRRHGACLGLGVMVKRLRKENRHAQADKVAEALTACQGYLDEIGQAQIKQAKGFEKPLDTLAEKAAKAITKLLPSGVFADTAEAVAWCKQYLPMTEARNQQTRNSDQWSGWGQDIAKSNGLFWLSFDGAILAGNGLDGNAVIAIGLERLED